MNKILIDNIFKYGFFLVVAIGIAAYMLKGRSPEDKALIDSLHNQIEMKNASIDSLEGVFLQKDKEYQTLLDSKTQVEADLVEVESKRVAAIKYYEKRIRNMSNLNVDELDSLFTERYRFNSSDIQEDSN